MVSLPEELSERVDDYRFEHRIRTDSEAIRRLIEAGLGKAKPTSGSSPGGARKLRSAGKSASKRQ